MKLKKPFVIQKERTSDLLEVINRIDDGNSVIVNVMIGEVNNGAIQLPIVCWGNESTPSYEEIGDWTEEQLESRILELLSDEEFINNKI